MRRLKDDIGIVEDRTAERNIEVEGDNITLTKKHNANKFIDLDTLWFSFHNGDFPMFVCFKITAPNTLESLGNGFRARKVIVISGETTDQDGYTDDVSSYTIRLNNTNGEYAETDLINLDDVGNIGTGVARDIHIYYAYTTMRQEYSASL